MKFKFTIIIILLAMYSFGCRNKRNNDIRMSLSTIKSNNNTFLKVKLINNTKKSIYLPKLSGLLLSNNLSIYNEDGENISDIFHQQELNDHIDRIGPQMGQVNNFCKNHETLAELHYLELPPFSKRKDIIKRMINCELKNILNSNDTSKLTKNDIHTIKTMIFSKYSNCIFLASGEVFNDCITINTLLDKNQQFKIVLNYPPLEKIEEYYYQLEHSRDSLKITTELPIKFEEYELFDNEIFSNRLILNKIN